MVPRLVIIRKRAESEMQVKLASLWIAKTDITLGCFAKPLIDQEPKLILVGRLQLPMEGKANEFFQGNTKDFREARVRVKNRGVPFLHRFDENAVRLVGSL